MNNIEKYQKTVKTRFLIKSFLQYAIDKHNVRLFESNEEFEAVTDSFTKVEVEQLIDEYLGIDSDQLKEEIKNMRDAI